jgi:hypothetical protein
MRPRILALALLLLPALPFVSGLEAPIAAAPGVPQVDVVGPRVRIVDVMPTAPADVASLDLGAAPAVGGTRVVSREEIVAAIVAAKAKQPKGVPDAVRVARKVKTVGAADLEKELRASLKLHPLAKGGALVAVRPPKSIDVGAGWDRVVVDVPRPPRKTGPWSTTATLVFARGEETLGKVSLPIDVALPAAAAIPDVAQKAGITLVIERGQVEVSVRGTANVDGDVGEIIPITIPSGKVLRGRIATKDRANCVEGT